MGKRQRGFLFWKLLTLSWSWHLIQIFRLEVLWRSDDPGWCLSLTRRSQLVVPDWDCHRLSVRRERESWDMFCVHQLWRWRGRVLSRRLEQVRLEVWKVWRRTKRGLSRSVSWRCLTTPRTCVGCQGGGDDGGCELGWEMKLEHIHLIQHTRPELRESERDLLFATLNCALWEHKTLSAQIFLNPGNLYVIILFTTSCGWWKWVEVSKLRVRGL